jgi:hypothetical protein
MRLLTSGEVCTILSTLNGERFVYRTLHNWIKAGVLTPIVDREGSGNHREFSLIDVLGIAAGRSLRATLHGLPTAAAVMAVIRSFDEEYMLASFKRGATCLLFMGDQVLPRLVSEKDASEVTGEFADAFQLTSLRPQLIDVGHLYQNILNVIEGKRKRRRRPMGVG